MLTLLSADSRPAGSYAFSPSDNQELFEKNLREQPLNWVWRTRSVTYTLNSQGFRCGEFEDLDWNNSILAFGCSNTFGIGVDDSDTWPSRLSQFIMNPVINLAQGGQGWGFNWVNSVRVIEAGHRPRAVVYYWPTVERMFTLPDSNNPNRVMGHGYWNTTKDPALPEIQLGLLWAQDPVLSAFWAEHYRRSLDIMWSLKGVPVLHYTWDGRNPVSMVEHVPVFSRTKDNNQLRARDLMHPGVEDHAIMALRISVRLNRDL
jgi:hypothetical protein